MMISTQAEATGTLMTVQTFLFDGGRMLLTASVVLFLGYAIFVMSALLISALNAVAIGAWKDVRKTNESQVRAAGIKHGSVAKTSGVGNAGSVTTVTGAR